MRMFSVQAYSSPEDRLCTCRSWRSGQTAMLASSTTQPPTSARHAFLRPRANPQSAAITTSSAANSAPWYRQHQAGNRGRVYTHQKPATTARPASGNSARPRGIRQVRAAAPAARRRTGGAGPR